MCLFALLPKATPTRASLVHPRPRKPACCSLLPAACFLLPVSCFLLPASPTRCANARRPRRWPGPKRHGCGRQQRVSTCTCVHLTPRVLHVCAPVCVCVCVCVHGGAGGCWQLTTPIVKTYQMLVGGSQRAAIRGLWQVPVWGKEGGGGKGVGGGCLCMCMCMCVSVSVCACASVYVCVWWGSWVHTHSYTWFRV